MLKPRLRLLVLLLLHLLLGCLVVSVHARPTIYKRNHGNVFEPVMVPVSSTVIPIPVYKVEYGLGFAAKEKKDQASSKPEGGVKLITARKSENGRRT